LEAERAAGVRGCGYTVVLSVIGGDEFLRRFPDPSAQLADLIVQFKLVSLAHQLMAWSLVKRWPWVQLLWQASVGLLPASLREFFAKQGTVETWIEKDFAKRIKLASRLLGPKATSGLVLPTRRSYICGVMMMGNKLAKCKSPILALEEVRYPYLDQTLIDFLVSIPASQLLRPGERRSLMRRSLVGLVPQEILARRTKQFGERTAVVALEKNWEELRTALDSPLSSALGYINQRRFLEKLHAARSGKEIHIVRMIRTISLEFWLRDLVARGLIDCEAVSAPSVRAISIQVNA